MQRSSITRYTSNLMVKCVDNPTSNYLEFFVLTTRKRTDEPITLDLVRSIHSARREAIRARLAEFREVWQQQSNELLWEELVFCIFTAGASARMGLRSVETVRTLLKTGTHAELAARLQGVHRYPRARAGYIVETRNYLTRECNMDLQTRLESFSDLLARRDWLAKERGIKGLGYKEASHYLRNIGYRGYAILDKHILRSLYELKVIESPQPPPTRAKYLATEARMRAFAEIAEIDFDELDLVLWSIRTGEILK